MPSILSTYALNFVILCPQLYQLIPSTLPTYALNFTILYALKFPIFTQVYQVAYVIVKSALSPRPGNWVLERSVDGREYKPWQYYAISDTECISSFGVPPTRGRPSYTSDTQVICTSYFSRLNPLEGGEVGLWGCVLCSFYTVGFVLFEVYRVVLNVF